MKPIEYGNGDATYQAIGGEQGLITLIDRFYDIMGSRAEYSRVWEMHPADKNVSRDKLARFLMSWTGGPSRYKEKYGPISIPKAHAHLEITAKERDQWLNCMGDALRDLGYAEELTAYLLEQLAVPANRILQACER
ncbi:MAG: hemoglobin [Halioglobus sp.]|jgi:hemoglobin